MRWVIGIFFVLHGIGHSMGFLAAWTRVEVGFSDAPWILPGDVAVKSPVGAAWGVLWAVALVGWVAAGIGVLSRSDSWETLAIASAIASLAAILPWWRTVPGGAKAGALVDVVVLVGLLTPWGRDLADRLA